MTPIFDSLIGRWEGRGKGDYPTIDSFEYHETVEFSPLADKPVLAYTQRTRSMEGKALHAESGFLRFAQERVELVIAQPTGIAEIHRGSASADGLELIMDGLVRSPTSVEVSEVRRSISVIGDVLSYRLDMAAVGQGLQYHLEAELHRTSGNGPKPG